jgi:hypothetical protein
MDLNEFIYRDDTAEVLGDEIDGDDFVQTAGADGFALPAKLGLATMAGAIVGLSHFLGQAAKHL